MILETALYCPGIPSNRSLHTCHSGLPGYQGPNPLLKPIPHRIHPTTINLALISPPLPLQITTPAPLHAHPPVASAHAAHATASTAAASHPDGLAHQARGVAGHCPGAEAQQPLDAGRQVQAEAREEGGQGAAGDERQDDEREDLEGVPARVVGQVPQETPEVPVGAGEEAGPRGAAV